MGEGAALTRAVGFSFKNLGFKGFLKKLKIPISPV